MPASPDDGTVGSAPAPSRMTASIRSTLLGGYITFAGAHRLLDSGVSGPRHIREITHGSVNGVIGLFSS